MDSSKNFKPEIAKINPTVFWGSVILCLIFYVPMVVFKESAQPFVVGMMSSITHSLDWLWLAVGFFGFIFLMWLAFGRYGNVKLGGPDDEPEFSFFSWMSMMFCGGVGCGLVYWTFLEPVYYVKFPPFWVEPFSAQAAQWSLAYGIFHWGFVAWGFFAVCTIAFSYMYYVRKKPYLYPSYACRGVLGDAVDGWVGKAIDIFVIVGLVGGVGTSLGVCVPMISAIVADYIGVPDNFYVQGGVTIVWSLLFGYSCYKGLYSGIAKLSELNAKVCLGLVIFVLVAGPTVFMLSLYFDNLGMLFQNMIRMSLYTDPITKSGFPQDWTVFYWAWWVAWTIYIGLFATRISRGRTIKQVILNMTITATFGCSIFYLVFGGYAVDLIYNKGMAIDQVLAQSGGPAMIVEVLNTMPMAKIFIPIFVVVMLIFQATSIDSNAYTMAMIGCKEIKGTQEPPTWARAFWAVMLLFVTIALMSVGGIKVVQLSSVLTSVPILFIIIILAISTVKWLKEDIGDKVGPGMIVVDYKGNGEKELTIAQESKKAINA